MTDSDSEEVERVGVTLAPAVVPTATDDTGFQSLATPSDFSYRLPFIDRRGQSVPVDYARAAGQSADPAGPRPDRGGLEPRTRSVTDYVTVERGRPRSSRESTDAMRRLTEQLDNLQRLVTSETGYIRWQDVVRHVSRQVRKLQRLLWLEWQRAALSPARQPGE